MTREEASDLAKFTAEALGAPYCVCRRRDDHEWWAALSEEAMVHFQGEWACPEYEVVELWRPDGRQIIAVEAT